MGVALKMPSFKRPALKLPSLKEVPRPTRWDWAAIGVLGLGLVLAIVNIIMANSKPPDQPFPQGMTWLFVFLQLAVSLGGLLVLGKTAKEGTWWGNLAAVGATFVGMTGVLLAWALWAAA